MNYKNNKRIIILVLATYFSMVFILTGCTNSIQTDIEPEPYTKMLESITANDLILAEKYADLVINDFQDSKYAYNAYFIKNTIISSKIMLSTYELDYLSKGTAQMGVLNDENDIDKVRQYCNAVFDNIETYHLKFVETLSYVLDNYEKSNEINLHFNKAPKGIIELSDSDIYSLYWFSQMGYPIPDETDVNLSLNDKFVVKTFYELTDGYNEETEFSYVSYFYYMAVLANSVSEKELYVKCLNKVIELTEDDKYNKYRIQVEEALKNIKE